MELYFLSRVCLNGALLNYAHRQFFMFASAMCISKYVDIKICVCHNVGTAAKCDVTWLEPESNSCISDTGHENLSSRWS